MMVRNDSPIHWPTVIAAAAMPIQNPHLSLTLCSIVTLIGSSASPLRNGDGDGEANGRFVLVRPYWLVIRPFSQADPRVKLVERVIGSGAAEQESIGIVLAWPLCTRANDPTFRPPGKS